MSSKAYRIPGAADRQRRQQLQWQKIQALLNSRNTPTAVIPTASSGSSGAGATGGGTGNFLPTSGGTMSGNIAFEPKLIAVSDGRVDLDPSSTIPKNSTNILVTGQGTPDDIYFIDGAERRGQYLIYQGTNQQIQTIKNANLLPASFVGDGITTTIVATLTDTGTLQDGDTINVVGAGNFDVQGATVASLVVDTSFEYDLGSIGSTTPDSGTVQDGNILTFDGNDIILDGTLNSTGVPIMTLKFDTTASAFGAWRVMTTTDSGGGTGTSFPILYPKEDLTPAIAFNQTIDLSVTTGNAKQIQFPAGDIGFQITGDPAITVGEDVYVMFIQDDIGGRSLSTVDSAIKNGSLMDTLLDKNPDAKTTFRLSTLDGGVSYHAILVDLSTASGGLLSTLTIDVSKDWEEFAITNLGGIDLFTTPTNIANPVTNASFMSFISDGAVTRGQIGRSDLFSTPDGITINFPDPQNFVVSKDSTTALQIDSSDLLSTFDLDFSIENTSSNPVVTLFRDEVGVTDNFLGNLIFKGQRSNGTDFVYSAIASNIDSATLGLEESTITLNTTSRANFGFNNLIINADSEQKLRYTSVSNTSSYLLPVFELVAQRASVLVAQPDIGQINFNADTDDGGGIGAIESFAQIIATQEDADITNESGSLRFRVRDQSATAGTLKTYLQFNDTSSGEIQALKNLDMNTNDITSVDRLQISGGTSSVTSVNDVVWYLDVDGNLISNVNSSDGWIWSSGNVAKMILTDSTLEKRNVTAPNFQLYNTRTAAVGTAGTIGILANSANTSTGVTMGFMIADTEVATGDARGSLKFGVNLDGIPTLFLTLNEGNNEQVDILTDLDMNTNDILMGTGGNIVAGGAGEGVTNIGHLDFVDNQATPLSALSIYSDGTDMLVNTGGGVVNLSDVADGVFLDSTFRIQGSGDLTKFLAFEIDTFTTATTRTFGWPDSDGTVFITPAQDDLNLNTFDIFNIDSLTFMPTAGTLSSVNVGFSSLGSGGFRSNVLDDARHEWTQENTLQMLLLGSTTFNTTTLSILGPQGASLQFLKTDATASNATISINDTNFQIESSLTNFSILGENIAHITSSGLEMQGTNFITTPQIGFSVLGNIIQDDVNGMIFNTPVGDDFTWSDGTDIFTTIDKDSVNLNDQYLLIQDIAVPTVPTQIFQGQVFFNEATNRLNFQRRNDGDTAWEVIDLESGGGANTALSNLITTSINESLIPDTDNTLTLGESGAQWNTLWITTLTNSATIAVASPTFSVSSSTIILGDATTDNVSFVGQVNTNIVLEEIAEPASAPTDTGRFYAKESGGVSVPFWKDEAGTETNMIAGSGGEVFTWTATHNASGYNFTLSENGFSQILNDRDLSIPTGEVWFQVYDGVGASETIMVLDHDANEVRIQSPFNLNPSSSGTQTLGIDSDRWDAAWIDAYVDFDDSGTPATPGTGEGRIFWNNITKSLHQVDDTGTDTDLSSASAGANQQLSNLSGTVSVNLDLIPNQAAGGNLGSTTATEEWFNLYTRKVEFPVASSGVSAGNYGITRTAVPSLSSNVPTGSLFSWAIQGTTQMDLTTDRLQLSSVNLDMDGNNIINSGDISFNADNFDIGNSTIPLGQLFTREIVFPDLVSTLTASNREIVSQTFGGTSSIVMNLPTDEDFIITENANSTDFLMQIDTSANTFNIGVGATLLGMNLNDKSMSFPTSSSWTFNTTVGQGFVFSDGQSIIEISAINGVEYFTASGGNVGKIYGLDSTTDIFNIDVANNVDFIISDNGGVFFQYATATGAMQFTGSAGMQMNTDYLDINDVTIEPATPSSGFARLFVFDAGGGDQSLRVKFDNGTVVTIAND